MTQPGPGTARVIVWLMLVLAMVTVLGVAPDCPGTAADPGRPAPSSVVAEVAHLPTDDGHGCHHLTSDQAVDPKSPAVPGVPVGPPTGAAPAVDTHRPAAPRAPVAPPGRSGRFLLIANGIART